MSRFATSKPSQPAEPGGSPGSSRGPSHGPSEPHPVPSAGAAARAAMARGLGWVAGLWAANYRLRRDGERHGQEAFRASPFRRLALTHSLSVGADAVVTIALAGSLFFNISVHAARGRVALSLLLTIAPFAVVAPLLGPLIDRARGGRRAMIVASATGRAVACVLMARYIHGLLLFPAAFLTLVSAKAYTVAKAALVPAVVARNEDLVEANSKLAVGGSLAGFLAVVPGIPILKLFGAATLLRADSVAFLVCAISALRLEAARPAPPVAAASRPNTGVGASGEVSVGAELAPATEPATGAGPPEPELSPGALTAAAVAMGTLRFLVGFMVFLVAFALRRTHAPAWWYGLILAMSVGGNLVGSAIAPRLRSKLREQHILSGALFCVVAGGIVAIPMDLLQRRPAAALVAAMVGIAAATAKLAFDALVQREVPAASQGRVFGRLEAMFQLLWVVGALVPVTVAISLGAGHLVVMTAAGVAMTTYLVGLLLARHHRLPSWWPGAGAARPAPVALAGAVGLARLDGVVDTAGVEAGGGPGPGAAAGPDPKGGRTGEAPA